MMADNGDKVACSLVSGLRRNDEETTLWNADNKCEYCTGTS